MYAKQEKRGLIRHNWYFWIRAATPRACRFSVSGPLKIRPTLDGDERQLLFASAGPGAVPTLLARHHSLLSAPCGWSCVKLVILFPFRGFSGGPLAAAFLHLAVFSMAEAQDPARSQSQTATSPRNARGSWLDRLRWKPADAVRHLVCLFPRRRGSLKATSTASTKACTALKGPL